MSRDDRLHHLLRARDWQDRPELEHLCDWWRDIGGGLVALVGIGGAGKTATIDRFLQIVPGGSADPLDPMQAPPRRSGLPATVDPFIFSFYDVPNEDSFFVELAGWLSRVASDCRPAALAADGGEKISLAHFTQWLENLARRRERKLLVLDGLEKVQDDGRRSGMYGHILDGRLRNLLLDIAEGRFGRLAVVVTTRFDLYDPAAEGVPYYWRTFVESLAVETCVNLLQARGVKEPDDKLLKRLAIDHGCHALTVDLIGGYIGEFCDGDVSKLKPLGEIDLSDIDIRLHPRRKAVIEQERRFARVAERYQETLSEQEPATLALLQRLCLFHLGVDAATLTSIFTGDDEQTLNVAGPALAALTADQLQQTLDRLTAMKLVEVGPVPTDQDDNATDRPVGNGPTFTIHPAVRDGFLSGIAERDRTAGHEAARAGLTAALGDSPGENPSAPAILDLLEEIVHHTLQSGHVQEAWDVYWNRIGGGRNLLWRLGAYERGERLCRAIAGGQPPESIPSNLTDAAVQAGPRGSHQADQRDHSGSAGASPSPFEALPESTQAIFLNEWALYLSQLGRLEAAAHCHELHLEVEMQREDWKNSTITNQNLCDVRLLSGRLLEKGEEGSDKRETTSPVTLLSSSFPESLRLAELADDAQERQNSYASRGHARALLGEVPAALSDFHTALDWQHKDEGDDERPLYSGRGIRHTDLLARLGRRKESQRLTEANQEICLQVFGAGDADPDVPQCRLILASLQLDSGDVSAAERQCHAARDWALARDAKQVLCWSALVQARIELAKYKQAGWALDAAQSSIDTGVPLALPVPDSNGGQQLANSPTDLTKTENTGKASGTHRQFSAAQTAIDAGLKIAQACGFSLYHIDLHVELARLRLLQGKPSEALAALRTALDETRPKNAETGEPELLAALDPNCGYAWPVPEALQLRAEALLLQAAQECGSTTDPEFVVTTVDQFLRDLDVVCDELREATEAKPAFKYPNATLQKMIDGRPEKARASIQQLVQQLESRLPEDIDKALKELKIFFDQRIDRTNVDKELQRCTALIDHFRTTLTMFRQSDGFAAAVNLRAQAVGNLTEALELWQPLHDPEPERDDQNFKLNGKEYNYKAAETHRIHTDLEVGILTRYPIQPAKTEETTSQESAVINAAEITTTDSSGTQAMRDQVFISYSHRDKEWLDKLHDTLKPLLRKQTIDVWADTRIKTGAKWKTEITKALARAQVAVLLVSRNFLASDFIADKEIPPILAAAENEGLTVVWVPIGACLYEETEIAEYQSAIDPATPLKSLPEAEQDAALVEIARKIRNAASSPS
tara:strand:- start:31606 stop:35547 length:3942 start_codon:yes stop_codon:yes gene_type:complete